mmetsp:Transcript_11694/g.17911  ORF Transcript_11694/g.17911 Transcript_11694/m.17911 type:complete len:258 (+) Transcript_11694:60-833(+)
MAVTAISPTTPASSSRRSRQIVEEELWLLRSRSFVKSESRRLNSLSPRYSRNEEFTDRPTPRRRWRRRVRRGDENNFAERMRDAARKARVFQLRVSGGRSWWPSMNTTPTKTARIDADVSDLPPNRRDELVLKKLTLTDGEVVSSNTKNLEGPKTGHESKSPKQKFEWNTLWKKKNRSHDQSETATVIEECADVDTSLNTTLDDQEVADEGQDIKEIEDYFEKEERKKKKNRQNIVVAAVATTSVSGLGVALAIILL